MHISFMFFTHFSSILQIPGESTLRRNFAQIQEGEGRRTPNPFYQPPAPPKGAHNHRLHHASDDSGLGVFNNNDLQDMSSDLDHRPHHDGLRHGPLHGEPHWDRIRHGEPRHDIIRHPESSRDELCHGSSHPQGLPPKMHHNHHVLPASESIVNPQQQKGRIITSKQFSLMLSMVL